MRGPERLALAVAMLGGLISASVNAAPGGAGDIREQSRRLTAVREWQMTFRYRQDVAYENDLGARLGGEHRYDVEAEGTVRFTRSRRRGYYQGDGEVNFSLDYSTLTRMNDYRILDVERAEGSAPILPDIEISYLRFDLDTFTYSFDLLPGEETEGDFGIPSRSYRIDNVTETFLREAQEEGTPIPYPELLLAMAPPVHTWDEFTSTFSVSAFAIPLPFFGLRLAGSTTDYAGGIVTWVLEPADGTVETFTSEREPELEGFEASESWVHYHPPSADEREELESAWEPIRDGIEDEADAEGTEGGGAAGATAMQVFVVAPTGTGPATGCGDVLQPVAPSATHDADAETTPLPAGLDLAGGGDGGGDGGGELTVALLSRLMEFEPPVRAGSALRNVAREHGLFVQQAVVREGRAEVTISAMPVEFVECDATRVAAQVRHTALQLPGVTDVQVSIGAREAGR